MKGRLYRMALLVTYQLCYLVAMLALPLALATRRVGYTPPLGRLLDRVGAAYQSAHEGTQ